VTETVHEARQSYACASCAGTIPAGQLYTLERSHGDTFPRQWENRRTCRACRPFPTTTPTAPPTSIQIGLF
jgi:hypothetical protein